MLLRNCRILLESVRAKLTFRRFSTSADEILDLAYTKYENRASRQCPVFVLHGIFSSRASWEKVSEHIHKTTGRTVVNVDARNHGHSPHSLDHTYVQMARDTRKLMQTLGFSKISLLGHSMGGRTAMVLSLLYPNDVSSLILVDISPMSISHALTTNFPRILNLITSIDMSGFTSVEEATTHLKNKLVSFRLPPDVVNFFMKNVGMKPDRTAGWLCNTEVLKENFVLQTKFPHFIGKKFKGPTMFIGGGQSDFIPNNDETGIKNYFPQAHIQYIPGGHNLQDENPNDLLKLVTEFLLKNV